MNHPVGTRHQIFLASFPQIYLKRKNTCHTGVGHAAGWIIPMAWLIANERVRDYGCNSVRAAAEYFNKACAPGARSPYFQNRSVHLGTMRSRYSNNDLLSSLA